jgi:hypothetical protein
MVEAREFTPEGLAIFEDWLGRAEKIGATRLTTEPPPTRILEDDRYSKRLGFAGRLPERKFVRKYDLGMAICTGLGPENADRMLLIPNVWPWLSLLYHDTTFPQKNGKWQTGDDARHLIQAIHGRKQDQSHRHLVKSAVTNVLRFREYAVVLMGNQIGQSKIEEQVMSRRVNPPLAHHKEFVKTLYLLYWDAEADDVKRGASGEGAGSVMHMIDLLTQFDMTFDIASLEVNDFMRLLPNDFGRFLHSDSRTSKKPATRPTGKATGATARDAGLNPLVEQAQSRQQALMPRAECVSPTYSAVAVG